MYAPPAERHVPAVHAPAAAPFDTSEPLERGLLASPAFWAGGALSVLAWTGIALLVLRAV